MNKSRERKPLYRNIGLQPPNSSSKLQRVAQEAQADENVMKIRLPQSHRTRQERSAIDIRYESV